MSEQTAPEITRRPPGEHQAEWPEQRNQPTDANRQSAEQPPTVLEPRQSPQHDTTAQRAAQEDGAVKLEGILQRTLSDPVALYTAVLTAFTGILAVATVALWAVTNKAANAAKVGAEATAKAAEVAERLRLYIADGSHHIT